MNEYKSDKLFASEQLAYRDYQAFFRALLTDHPDLREIEYKTAMSLDEQKKIRFKWVAVLAHN